MRLPGQLLQHHRGYRWWVFASISLGTFTSVADVGSAGVAMPSIAAHFDASLSTVQWVAIGYLLTISALLMPMGRLSDLVGRKSIYVLGFCLFVAGAGLAGFADRIETLILFRIIQGVGAAMTQGTGMATIISTFPAAERGKALGAQLGVVGTGGVAGPAIGGFITGALGWRWVFHVNALLAAVATLAALLVLVGTADRRKAAAEDAAPVGGAPRARARYDWPGAALSATLLVSFLLSVTNGSRVGWTQPTTVASLAVFAGSLAAFIWWELRVDDPMLDLRMFGRRLFTLGVVAGFLAFIGSASMRFLMPFYLQSVRGLSPSEVGLIIVPGALAMILAGPLSGRLSDRFGWRRFTFGGLLVSALGLLVLSRVGPQTSLMIALIGIVLSSAGTGIFNPANNSSILSTVARSRYGIISAFLNLTRNAGNVTGTAVATAVVAVTMASAGVSPELAVTALGSDGASLGPFLRGLRTAYLVTAALVTVGAFLSLLRPRPADAANEAAEASAPAASPQSANDPRPTRSDR